MSSNATAEGTDKRAVPQNARTMYHQPEASPDLKHRLIAVAPDQRWVATALGTSLTIIQAQCVLNLLVAVWLQWMATTETDPKV